MAHALAPHSSPVLVPFRPARGRPPVRAPSAAVAKRIFPSSRTGGAVANWKIQKSTSSRSRRTTTITMAVPDEDDDDAPELPDYDVVVMGPLETSAIALGVSGWKGGSNDANAYVLAIDRGYVLIGAQSPSEVALMKEYEGYWATSEAATLPGVRAPKVYATIEVGGTSTVMDALQAHSIPAGGAEPDIFCFKMAAGVPNPAGEQIAIANGIKAAWEMGLCPGTIAVEGYNVESLEALVAALSDAPEIKLAFNRVPFSLAQHAPVQDGTLDACKRLGIGVVAVDPLGEESCVVNETHPECDQGQLKLLAFLGSMVGGGVQRSPMQVALNYVMSKGVVPELTTRIGSAVWECGGAMLWRLDENAVGILDERAAATAAGKTGGGGGGEGPVAA